MGARPTRWTDAAVVPDDRHNHALKSRAAAVSIASNATLIVFKLAVGVMSARSPSSPRRCTPAPTWWRR